MDVQAEIGALSEFGFMPTGVNYDLPNFSNLDNKTFRTGGWSTSYYNLSPDTIKLNQPASVEAASKRLSSETGEAKPTGKTAVKTKGQENYGTEENSSKTVLIVCAVVVALGLGFYLLRKK